MAFVPCTDIQFIYKLFHPIIFGIAFKKFLRILSYILYDSPHVTQNRIEQNIDTMRCNKVIIIGVLLPQLLLSYYIASHLYSILFYSIDSRAKTFFNLQAGRARTFFSQICFFPPALPFSNFCTVPLIRVFKIELNFHFQPSSSIKRLAKLRSSIDQSPLFVSSQGLNKERE